MKKIFASGVALLGVLMIMGTAGFRTVPSLLEPKASDKTCVGYTIIAFDQGIDCYGDTIRLVRKNGYAERE